MVNQTEIHERSCTEDRYLNLFGSGVDEGAEITKNYEAAKLQYPYVSRRTCAGADAQLKAITAQISNMNEQLTRNVALGSNGRPMRIVIDGYTQLKNEISRDYYNMYCDSYLEKQANEQFLDSQIDQLKSAQSLVKKDNTNTYIVYGMIGAVVIVAGVLIFKK